MWGIYVGCLPSKADEVLAICRDEIARVVDGGLTDAELARGKGQVRGSIVLSLEDPSSRMSRLGKSELVYPRLEPVDEVLAAIDAVATTRSGPSPPISSPAPRPWPSSAPSTMPAPSRPESGRQQYRVQLPPVRRGVTAHNHSEGGGRRR